MLLALGSNGSGQLGIGNLHDVAEPTTSGYSLKLAKNVHYIAVAAGGNHTLVLSSSGDLYITGSIASQTGTIDANSLGQFSLLWTDVTICAATWEASIFTVHNGSALLTCGTGTRGELGLGAGTTSIEASQTQSLKVPGLGEDDLRVVSLAASMQHTVAVLSDGKVYGWGNGRKGQLGEPSGVVWYPRRIQGLDFKVVKVACGREFTILVGDSQQGQLKVLGNDRWRVRTDAPPDLLNWIHVGACWASILVLYKDGSTRSWGRNDHGQLAPHGLPLISFMASGSEHSIGVTSSGKVLAWGWGEHGNCGAKIDNDGDVKGSWNELSVPRSTAVRGVGAGCATSWVWT